MPRRKSAKKLEDLCWQTVIQNLDLIKQEAEYLPDIFINKLYQLCNDYLFSKKKDTNIDLKFPAKLFLRSTIDQIDLPNNFDLAPNEVTKIVRQACTRLKQITLRNYYVQVAHNKPRLTHLELEQCFITKKDLAIITENCPKLQHLSFHLCAYITDEAIQYLPPNITYLALFYTNVTEKGCLLALNSLKSLKELRCEYWFQIIQLLSKETRPKIFSIERLSILINVLVNENIGDGVVEFFPKLRDFDIALDTIPDLMNIINHKITSLTMYQYDVTDISRVGHFCPMLQEFHISLLDLGRIETNFLTSVEHVPFKHLLKFYVDFKNFALSKENVLILLRNCHGLKELQISNCDIPLNEFFADIMRANPLHHLKCLKFSNCNLLTLKTVILMVKLLRSLNSLTISLCKNITPKKFNVLEKLIKDNNWDITLSVNKK